MELTTAYLILGVTGFVTLEVLLVLYARRYAAEARLERRGLQLLSQQRASLEAAGVLTRRSPRVAAVELPAPAKTDPMPFGAPGVGFFDLAERACEPWVLVTDPKAELQPGQLRVDGRAVPTPAQLASRRHQNIVKVLLAGAGDLQALDLSGQVAVHRAREALHEIGLESLAELESPKDAMHVRARCHQGYGRLGHRGAFSRKRATKVAVERRLRRLRGEPIGILTAKELPQEPPDQEEPDERLRQEAA